MVYAGFGGILDIVAENHDKINYTLSIIMYRTFSARLSFCQLTQAYISFHTAQAVLLRVAFSA